MRVAGDQFWDTDDDEVLGLVMEDGLVDQCPHEVHIDFWVGVYKRVAAAARQTTAEGGSVREQAPNICAQLRRDQEEKAAAAERHARGPSL